MAFSLRNMLSNISYFTKPENDEIPDIGVRSDFVKENRCEDSFSAFSPENIAFDYVEADSTSKCSNLKLPNSVKNYAAKKGSLSDTDLLNINIDAAFKQDRKKCKKLKVDIKKASQSMNASINYSEDSINVENTPKHKLLDCKSAELFKGFNFNQSFDISDSVSIASSCEEIDIESLSEHSDTDISGENEDDKTGVKMCRKVEHQSQLELLPLTRPESFADVEVDRNEDERITLLLSYQMKLEKIECLLKKLLTEFEFHIEVSKIFNCKSIVTALPNTDLTNIPKTLGDVTYIDNIQRGVGPAGWNIIMEKEDGTTKAKLKNQLFTMRRTIDEFINTHLQEPKPKQAVLRKSKTFDMHKGERWYKPNRLSYKKKIKNFDFPDLREAMINLFSAEDGNNTNVNVDESDCSKCLCQCHTPSDSELTNKSDKEISNQSITSSIGNFTLDSTTLSAYSESLDQIISYTSFNDTNNSLYNTLLQKATIERITFYIQVHSIQLKCEPSETEFESKNIITFHCPTCKTTEYEENGLLKHILSPSHCEKIHFVYKTAYVNKCISGGMEIQPSTVLNTMTMYRDKNKIVCFGDAVYACSLCFENLIVGESILMSHCSEEEHIHRREMLSISELLKRLSEVAKRKKEKAELVKTRPCKNTADIRYIK